MLRFEMDVATAGVDRSHQDRTDQANDRCQVNFRLRYVACQLYGKGFLDRVEVGHLHVDDGLPGIDAVVKPPVQHHFDIVLHRNDRLDTIAGNQFRFANGIHVVRGNHRQFQAVVFQPDRHRKPLAGQLLGHQPHDLGIDRLGDDLHERHAVLLGKGLAELVDGDQPAAQHNRPHHTLFGALGR